MRPNRTKKENCQSGIFRHVRDMYRFRRKVPWKNARDASSLGKRDTCKKITPGPKTSKNTAPQARFQILSVSGPRGFHYHIVHFHRQQNINAYSHTSMHSEIMHQFNDTLIKLQDIIRDNPSGVGFEPTN